nr:MAG TPA_asm: hypothetical protein [Caudoviricetes sp.]
MPISCVDVPYHDVHMPMSSLFFEQRMGRPGSGGQGAGAPGGPLPIHTAPFPVSWKMGFVLQMFFVFMEFF